MALVVNGVFHSDDAVQVGCINDTDGRPFLNARAFGMSISQYLNKNDRRNPILASVNLNTSTAFLNSTKITLSTKRPSGNADFLLFARTNVGSNVITYSGQEKVYYFKCEDENGKLELVPALTTNGEACLFDKVSKRYFFKDGGSGSFIVGLTVNQAQKIGILPATGGSLTISLPSSIISGDNITNLEVNAALVKARAKGWNITVRSYDEETAPSTASTFGLRRIWVRKVHDEYGSYVDADGIRWKVDWCVTMYTPDDSTPDQYGYELFRSVEAAREYWGLSRM